MPTTLFLPRRSPLLIDPPRGAKVFTGAEPIEEITRPPRQAARRPPDRGRRLRGHRHGHPPRQLLTERFAKMRDTGSLMVITGAIDDMLSVYRGLPNEMKRGRSGLVLSPRATNDGDVLNVRLPRSASGAMPVGRGVLASPLGWTWVQVPRM